MYDLLTFYHILLHWYQIVLHLVHIPSHGGHFESCDKTLLQRGPLNYIFSDTFVFKH
uniref:Uncharacterized protein n=1 Tax=Anguilla anguilla TaxID=7936 RepID=A0A0E9QHY5_ANGAN